MLIHVCFGVQGGCTHTLSTFEPGTVILLPCLRLGRPMLRYMCAIRGGVRYEGVLANELSGALVLFLPALTQNMNGMEWNGTNL